MPNIPQLVSCGSKSRTHVSSSYIKVPHSPCLAVSESSPSLCPCPEGLTPGETRLAVPPRNSRHLCALSHRPPCGYNREHHSSAPLRTRVSVSTPPSAPESAMQSESPGNLLHLRKLKRGGREIEG